MSPNAHVAVHFSARTFSPKLAPIAFESQLTSVSPDGGLTSAGTVVVVAPLVVVVTMLSVVDDGCSFEEAVEQLATVNMTATTA